MFTDIVGYSALMSKDEKRAIAILEKNRILHNIPKSNKTREILDWCDKYLGPVK